jgi:hypothetical protein
VLEPHACVRQGTKLQLECLDCLDLIGACLLVPLPTCHFQTFHHAHHVLNESGCNLGKKRLKGTLVLHFQPLRLLLRSYTHRLPCFVVPKIKVE